MKVCDPCSSASYLPIGRETLTTPGRRMIGRKETQMRCIAYWKRAVEKQGPKHPAINCSNNPKGYVTTKELYESALNDTYIEGYGNAIDIYMYHLNK